jgi:flagellar export protein FliJ
VKKFSFQLNPLLKLRQNQREMCQQLLADVVRHDDELLSRRRDTEAERLTQIEELRTLGGAAREIDVDASSARRLYAGQLSGDLGTIDGQRTLLAGQIELCRQALVRADQAVKSLERLAERQEQEFQFREERREARALEETWQAIEALKDAP